MHIGITMDRDNSVLKAQGEGGNAMEEVKGEKGGHL